MEELGVAIGKDAKIQRRADFGFGDSMLDTQTCIFCNQLFRMPFGDDLRYF